MRCNEGYNVSCTDGLLEGRDVGRPKGCKDGFKYWVEKGLIDGKLEGRLNGAKVGILVGKLDGVVLGFAAGSPDGQDQGKADGRLVGVADDTDTVGIKEETSDDCTSDGCALGSEDGALAGNVVGSCDG